MLRWTDHTVETVAELVGYSGANYFCKAFRRARQMSPGEYRARFSGRPGAREERLLRRLKRPPAVKKSPQIGKQPSRRRAVSYDSGR